MKQKPTSSGKIKDSVAAILAIVSEEIEKADKQSNADTLKNWIEFGQSVIDKFGDAVRLENALPDAESNSCETDEDVLPPSSPALDYEEKFMPEAAASVLSSCILFCNAIIVGKEAAIGLKYDDENMYAPMIVLLERGASADALAWAAENLGVPLIKNAALAKNLASHGKAGESIPESCFRDVSLALAKLSSGRIIRLPRRAGKGRHGMPIKIPRPLTIQLGASIYSLIGEENERKTLLTEPLDIIRKKLKRLLGISIQPFDVSLGPRLKNDEYRILFKGLEAGRGRLELVMKDSENLNSAAKTFSSLILRHASEIVQRRAPELLGRDEVEAILNAAEEKYPVVTGEVKGLLSLGMVREILMSLVSEQVSIRYIAVILEALADWGSIGPAPAELIIDQIRQSLKRQICMEYADEKMTLRVLTLEPKLEKRFADRSPAGDWAELVSSAARGMEEKGFPPVVLCSPKARSFVKEATRKKFPNLAVLSYMEIPPDISVEPLGEIRLEGSVRLPG